ncbi:MAG TPA: nicotinate-nucleotide adenylyltransferase [Gemmatimonadaceae bacterium]|nr:nicotinate-nucleotide adenylyltransferase [Gemmatimonadaceae bacterium]
MRSGAAGDRLGAEALTRVRLGLLGGTFDPPHVGHLLAASDAYEALALDRLLFVPAAVQPFKSGQVEATPAQRLRMLQLMVGDDPRFAVDPIEIDRSGLSYTVDTLAALAEREPGARRFLLIGEDLAGQIGSWREPRRIAELAEIVVLVRGDGGGAGGTPAAPALPITRIATRRVDVSSTEVRARVRAGRPIRGFVTDAVADFIRSAGLYR